jgi:hypothetical protein
MSGGRAHGHRSIDVPRIGAIAAILIILSSTAVACGGDDEVARTAPAPSRTAPETAITTDTVPPVTETTATEPTATTGVPPASSGGTTAPTESQPGGAGDEEAIRVPAAFAINGRRATPSVISVPAFLTVELRLTSRDGRPHRVRIDGVDLELAAGGTAVKRLEGLKKGDHPLVVDGAHAATLRVGTQPGP